MTLKLHAPRLRPSRLFSALAVVSLLLVAAGAARAQAPAVPARMKVEQVYQTYCASCHGTRFEGGLGGNLVDGAWKHGGSDEEIRHTIAKGLPQLGMVPWENTLSAEQIRAMVVFLREQEKNERYRNTTFPKPSPGQVTQTQLHAYRLEVLTEGLRNPWALAFLPDGRKLVTEKSGPVRVIDADWKLAPEPIAGTPPVMDHGQGGMLEVAAHPGYADNGWVYLGFADGWRDEGNRVQTITAVVRGRIQDGRWTDQQWIYKADRRFYNGDGVHFGTRFVFDDGYLYFVVGERGGNMQAQDVKRPNGKIFRLHDDGRVPQDNPFVGTPGAEPGIWSYGHRNPQGLVLDPRTHALYDTEHGPRGGDEFNLIQKGRNYGWPVITYGMNYDGTPMTSLTAKEGMEQPLTYWTPSIATCGLAFYQGSKFPKWENDFFVGSLAGQELRRLRLQDGKVVEQEVILKDLGRIRDVRCGPDGLLYLVTNTPDRILRLVPADR